MRLEEAGQAAPMVEMAMAQDQRIDRRQINAQKLDIVVEHIGSVGEVEQVALALAALLRSEVQREAPFAEQGTLELRPALQARLDDCDLRHFLLGNENVVLAI